MKATPILLLAVFTAGCNKDEIVKQEDLGPIVDAQVVAGEGFIRTQIKTEKAVFLISSTDLIRKGLTVRLGTTKDGIRFVKWEGKDWTQIY